MLEAMGHPPFADRAAAGRELAAELAKHETDGSPVVLGLARGGMEVAAEVARALDAELDVLVVRKVGHPLQPELGLGALAEDGEPVFDETGLARTGLDEDDLAEVVAAERAEARRRVEVYRRGRPPVDVTGRPVVLVDDGVATGVSARAALRALRARHPSRLVLAVPVAAGEALKQLAADADEEVALLVPSRFGAVSQWYERFDQTSDAQVVALLAR